MIPAGWGDAAGAVRLPAVSVSRATVLAALSQALDLTEGEPLGHALRTAWLADQLARAWGWSTADRIAVFYGALLKDAGCSVNAEAVYQWFRTDDRGAKHALKRFDWTRPSGVVGYAWRVTAPDRGRWERLRHLAGLVGRGSAGARELFRLRCTRGAELLEELGWTQIPRDVVLHLDEHWDGSGFPHGLRGTAIPPAARLVTFAQTVAVFWSDRGLEAAREMAHVRRGRWFDPAVVDLFETLVAQPGWGEAFAREAGAIDRLATWTPDPGTTLGPTDLLHLGAVFARIVDAKSPWTQAHSARVAAIAEALAQRAGWEAAEQVGIRLAGLWHDLGKLGVSTAILDKPGPLTPAERQAVEAHPRWTWALLRVVRPLTAIAAGAATHHERRDGSGYPWGYSAEAIPRAGQWLAVADVFDALVSPRPYKAPWDPDDAVRWLLAHTDEHFASEAVEALRIWVRTGGPDALAGAGWERRAGEAGERR